VKNLIGKNSFSGMSLMPHVGFCVIFIITLMVTPRPTANAKRGHDTPGFSIGKIASIDAGTDFAFLPDGRIIITEQTGTVYIYQKDEPMQIALNLANVICNNRERGVLGIAVDPKFAHNKFIYIYYTYHNGVDDCTTSSKPINRVSRFTLPNNNIISINSEVVILDNIASLSGIHNGGSINFGVDGYLYISVGDSGEGGALAQALNNLSGKILRIAPDGSVPPSNPFASGSNVQRCGAPNAKPVANDVVCGEIFAYGLRNPWRIAFMPNSTQFYINDVGQGGWEEIDDGLAGANYGWPQREGYCAQGFLNDCVNPDTDLTEPLYTYDHLQGCSSVTAGAFVPALSWGGLAAYGGKYLFGDSSCRSLFILQANAQTGNFFSELLLDDIGAIVTAKFNPFSVLQPNQPLYFMSYGAKSEVDSGFFILTYDPTANAKPVAKLRAYPTYGSAPLTVTFDSSQSNDANGDALTYSWDFGDGTHIEASALSNITHVYLTDGVYGATVKVKDTKDAVSTSDQIRLDVGNRPPAITLGVIPNSLAVGQRITLTASADDPEDGKLPSDQFIWRVLLHHLDRNNTISTHYHPYVAPIISDQISFFIPPPEDINAIQSYLEVQVSIADSLGMQETLSRNIYPSRVDINLNSNIPVTLKVNDIAITAPTIITSWQGYALHISAPLSVTSVTPNSTDYLFNGWQENNGDPLLLVTPNTSTTLQLNYLPFQSATFSKRVWLAVAVK
jgi:glucose/arabinose dehydrogenase/PKD repeat protein